MIAQDPQPGTRIACSTAVSLTLAMAEKPVIVRVGDLSTDAGIDRLVNAAAGCPGGLTVARLPRQSNRPKDAFVEQAPSAQTVFTCGMAVSVWTSTGPVPAPDLPDLVNGSIDAVTAWSNAVATACGRAPSITMVDRPSDRPRGTVIAQDRAMGPFTCGDPREITIAIAGGENPPWWPYIVAALAVAATVGVVLRWLLPVPRLVFGIPKFGGSTDAKGLAGALPVIALEARAGTAEISGSGALPIDRVETDDG